MGVLDNIKNKAEELLGEHSDKVDQHSDKVEQYSDQGLDMASDRIDTATGGKFGEHLETGRSAIDERIGESGATAGLDEVDNPMVDDAQGLDPAFEGQVGDGRVDPL